MAVVTLEEAKQYLPVDSSDEDAFISRLIETGEQMCADMARMEAAELEGCLPMARIAVLYAIAYLYKDREKADHEELALIPESFRTDVLKEEADTNEVLVENANSETVVFALLFEFDGDIRKIRHVLYNCSASRPKIKGKTNEESREVQTETLTVKARPLANGYVKAKTGNKTSSETYAGWYQSVYLPTPKTEEGQG